MSIEQTSEEQDIRLDKHSERLLRTKINHRQENVRSKLKQVKELTKNLESRFSAHTASFLASVATEMAANARSLEDLMDVAELPYEIGLKEE